MVKSRGPSHAAKASIVVHDNFGLIRRTALRAVCHGRPLTSRVLQIYLKFTLLSAISSHPKHQWRSEQPHSLLSLQTVPRIAGCIRVRGTADMYLPLAFGYSWNLRGGYGGGGGPSLDEPRITQG